MKIFSAIIILFTGYYGAAQNLVSNSGFETYSSLPTTVAQYYLSTGWGNCNGGGSPDYFHINGSGYVQLPNNFIGYVPPYAGDAVMGFCPYYNSQSVDFREYVSSALTSAMTAGTTYDVSFYETSGISNGSYCGMGIDKLSVAFTVGAPIQSGSSPMYSVTPQWTTPTIVYDTGWVQITFQFTAAAAYDHITFGSFVNDASTNAQTFAVTASPGAYYFIDGIDVHETNASQINFSASDTGFCEITCIDFTDQSNNNATAWQWIFPGGTPDTSSLQNPTSICYYTAGTYDVTLITTNANGNDTLTLTNFITVNANPSAPVITASNDTLYCSAASNYQWYLNAAIINGATDQFYVATQSGTYTVVITEGSGCSASSDYLFSLVAFNAPDTSLCEKFCISFSDQSLNSPTAWQWSFPGGNPSASAAQNPANICYNLPGTYDVTLITTNANGNDTLTLTNYITVHPTPPFPAITQAGYTLTSSPANSYQWQFNSYNIPGATNQSYIVLQTGYYTVIIGDANGCQNSTTVYVLISGVDELNDGSISIYPNPASDGLMVELLNGFSGNEITISLFNAIGQKVISSQQKISTINWKKQIDLHAIAGGIYFIEIKSGDVFMKKKILIMH